MITRPLELSDRLREPPRSFDSLFFVNAVLLGLYFAIFGSRFVIAPGVELENPAFQVPASASAIAGAMPAALVIDLPRPGVVFTAEGQQNYARMAVWLQQQSTRWPGARVLVRADAQTVPMQDLLHVFELIRAAGFEVQLAAEPLAVRGSGG